MIFLNWDDQRLSQDSEQAPKNTNQKCYHQNQIHWCKTTEILTSGKGQLKGKI
jgi:hypothetical protein